MGLSDMENSEFNNSEYAEMRRKESEYLDSHYDFYSKEGIESIQPTVKAPFDSLTGQIYYYLARKATEHKALGNMELAVICLKKALDICICQNKMYYFDKDYLRLIEYLKIERRFDEAREQQTCFEKIYGKDNSVLHKEILVKTFETAKAMETDFVETSYIFVCCEKCSMYQQRVFSISGQDKRFPKFPTFLLENPLHCGLSLHPFLLGASSMDLPNGEHFESISDIIKYSNRPFGDNRTKEQKNTYKEQIDKKKLLEESKKEFDILREYFPDVAPKSFGGYSRMKNLNSKNYKKLVLAISTITAKTDQT